MIVAAGLALPLLAGPVVAASEAGPGKTATSTSVSSPPQPKKAYVDVYVPSVTELAGAAKTSKTAALYDALSGLAPVPENETGEGLDLDAMSLLLAKIESWPDTSIGVAIHTQDREGRARWSISFDWPLETLVENLRGILADPAAKELLKNVELKSDEDGAYTIELPEVQLATLRAVGDGSMIASTDEVQVPEEMFGRDAIREMRAKADKDGKKPRKPYLAYCSLNFDSGEESGRGSSMLSGMVGVDAIQYALSMTKAGQWSEQFGVTWNPVIGAFLKAFFQKVKEPFDCPEESYVSAVMHLGMGEGMVDQLSGLPMGTIGSGVEGEMLFAAVPGSGFLPVPDVFFAFRAASSDKIVQSIRDAIDKDAKRRADDDLKPAWREETIEGRPVFWHDPAADGAYGMMPVTFRSVVFFDKRGDEEDGKTLLVIARTSNWADDAVRRWGEVTKKTFKLPSSKKNHWEARFNWRSAYQLAQPYLGLASSFVPGGAMPPSAGELSDALADSDLQVRIAVGGVRVRHIGPVPIGGIYVPAVAAAALGTAADPSSEAARERIACQNLRVLHHHAKLFRDDYDRWPATVSELDGYVDFNSHDYLLRLRPRNKSFMEGFTGALFGGGRKSPADENGVENEGVDDSLYVIDWSADDSKWKLKFRDDEFASYVTIYIDSAGEIHRVPKPVLSDSSPANGDGVEKVTKPREDKAPEQSPKEPEKKEQEKKNKKKRILI